MREINPRAAEFPDYRLAVRELCRGFGSSYWQGVEERGGYPDEFVRALTEAGWLAALIPAEYGGGGLGVTEASVILEEINRSGANSGACHAQMYIMGTLLRHGSAEQKQRYLPEIAAGKLRLQSFAVTEPASGTDTTQIQTIAGAGRRPLHDQWAEGVDLASAAFGPDAAAGANDTAGGGRKKTEGLSVFLVDLRGGRFTGMTLRPIRNMANHETNEMFFDGLEVPGGEPDRRGRQGIPLYPGRDECGADTDCGGMHRRRLLVHRSGAEVCLGAGGVRSSDRAEPGSAVSDCPGVRESAGGGPDAVRGGAPVR